MRPMITMMMIIVMTTMVVMMMAKMITMMMVITMKECFYNLENYISVPMLTRSSLKARMKNHPWEHKSLYP